ncbi:uncharacterized protein LOC130725797 [Lotus japonicus]|uniref:uncharacterized protein LOC130725797 n=1 Tax=Lotus japonicus TaxID=34305 RepID=UPI002582ABC9|nr:uncharacterized protein LOC130725797 [Lotus japonicus]
MEQDLPTFIHPCKLRGNSSASSRPLIPGPAGVVQAAMIQRSSTTDGHLIPTQQFVRRVVEDGHDTYPDFHSNAWLSALQLGGSATPLGSITHHLERVDLIVAVIKSCTPNGFGDVSVTLKDPTGTVGASVHHKVFTESEFAKDINVGSVMLIQKVAVFSPRKSNCYLNITLPNIVKVFSSDCGPPSETFTDITED